MINRTRLIETFTRLVAIDTPSLGERQMADYLKGELTALGLTVTEDNAGERLGGNCGNLHAWLDGDERLPPLLFSSHMDTVEPALGKRAVAGADGRITSGGDTVLGADDLAGVASILEALRTIRDRGLDHRPIELLLTVAEEKYCLGAMAMDPGILRAKEVYVLDLSGPVGSAAFRAPAIVSFTVTIRGRASHAGFAPEEGIHAIRAAALGISRLEMGRVDREMTVNVGTVTGGGAGNIVPDTCVVEGEVRGYDPDAVTERLRAVEICFAEAAGEVGASAEMAVEYAHSAYEMDRDHPAVRRFAAACSAAGAPFDLVSTYGGSDFNVLYGHGLRGLVIASAMENCHGVDEYTTVSEMELAAELTLQLMTSKM